MTLRSRWIGAVVICAACGGQPGPGLVAVGDRSGLLAPVDQSFTSYKEIELTGLLFAPEALGRPGMLRVPRARTLTLVRQRKRVRPGARPVEVHILASMLWEAADALICCAACAKGERACGDGCRPADAACDAGRGCACSAEEAPQRAAREADLRAEAHIALAKLASAQGTGKADRTTLRMLATAAMGVGDLGGAEVVYRQLIERFPEQAEKTDLETWRVAALLRQGKLGDAAAAVEQWPSPPTDPLQAYMLAWVRFARREYTPARDAILAAAAAWTGPGRPAVERDLLLILARGGAEADTAVSAVDKLVADDRARQRPLLERLAKAYYFAGDPRRAFDVLEQIRARVPSTPAGAAELVAVRFEQAEHQLRLGDPGRSAELIIAAHRELARCGKDCAGELANKVEDRLIKLATFFHSIYHESLDQRYYTAAETLYTHAGSQQGTANAALARDSLANLRDARGRASPQNGKHGEQVLYQISLLRAEAIKGCYEAVLLADHKLSGLLSLTLEIDHTGAVKGAASEPAAGLDGVPAVAACAIEHARRWTFPSRTVPGKTTIRLPYLLRPAAAP